MTATDARHAFLQFVPVARERRVLRDVALELMNFYGAADLSRKKWSKRGRLSFKWWHDEKDPGTGERRRVDEVSAAFGLVDVEQALHRVGSFPWQEFRIFAPSCPWLDAEVALASMFHFFDGSDAVTLKTPTVFGDSFPLVPKLDREGVVFSSFQQATLRRIGQLRKLLVLESDVIGEDNFRWFQDLRALVAECVSLIDMTLHQLYFKAEYEPIAGWRFDRAKLGSRHGQRLSDKMRWVHAITGTHVHIDEEFRRGFDRLRKLRNHLHHFDPPCFCMTIEDAAGWLNDVHAVAQTSWAIRRAIGSPLCVPLLELLIAPEVAFVPPAPQRPRLSPQPAGVGYASTRWNSDSEG